jgi:hypothetical protein
MVQQADVSPKVMSVVEQVCCAMVSREASALHHELFSRLAGTPSEFLSNAITEVVATFVSLVFP